MRHRIQLAAAALLLSAAVLSGAAACSGSGPETAETAELTRGQKDTIISKLPIRGSRGVGRALEAVEASQVRALEHDSIS